MSKVKKRNTTKKGKSRGSKKQYIQHRPERSKNRYDTMLAAVRTNPKDINARLVLGNYYLRNHLEEKIIEVLNPLEEQYPFTDNNQCAMYNRLLAFGYSHVNQLLDAEKICLRGTEQFPDALDFYYVCCYVHLSLREYDKVITSAQQYLRCWEKTQKNTTTPVDVSYSKHYLSQVHNFYGSALFEKTEWDEARKQFELSSEADPGNYLPYINRANIALRHKDNSTARAIAEEGLTKCRQGQELRMFLESLSSRATISACMIVKDEEELLPGCLDSIRDWVDEIIVVDTGSTDRTIEIAESYGATIFHQPWEGDFSKHRNYSIELATCDWVFIIDADERFNKKDVPLLLDSVNREEHRVISVNVFNYYGSINNKLTSVNSMRFFRRELNLRYRGIVHNSLYVPEGITISRAPIAMEHLGYDLSPEKMKAKFERSKALLEKQIEENPDFAFAWFNLAQLYRGVLIESLEKYGPLVLKAAERAVELTDHDDEHGDRHIHLMALDQLAWTYFYMKDHERAEHFAQRALALKPNYLDPLMLIGNIYANTKKYDKAMAAYQKYLDVQSEFNEHIEIDSLILFHPNSCATALYGMGAVSELSDDLEKAKKYYREAILNTPGYPDASLNLGKIYMNEGNFTDAEKLFLSQMDSNQPSVMAALGLGYIYLQQQVYEKAEQYYLRSLEIEPSNVTALVKTGDFFRQTDQIDRAKELYLQAYELDSSDTEVLQSMAALHFAEGNYQKATDLYKQILEQKPDQAEILNDLGNCFYKTDDCVNAEEYYQTALDTGMASEITFRNLGLVQIRLDKPNEAITALEKYMDMALVEEPGIIQMVGDLYSKIGEYNTALDYYEKSLVLQPSSPDVLYKLSECYLHMGHRDAALMGYRNVLAVNADFKPARARLDQLSKITEKA